jgi:hypothetical protein
MRFFRTAFHGLGYFSLLLLIVLGLQGIRSARADEFMTYISLSCDPANNRAILRFGYADDDDRPIFAAMPREFDWPGLKPPVAEGFPSGVLHDEPRDASCRIARGVEVKARYADAGAPLDWRFSVWVDEKKIVSKAALNPQGCGSCWIQSLLIENNTMRRCDFQLKDNDNVYDVITKPVPIVCGEPVPLSGEVDTIEYPPPGAAARPPVGSMLVSGDEQLCRVLVFDEAKFAEDQRDIPNRFPLGSQVVSLRNAGGAVGGFQRIDFPGLHNGRAEVAQLDFFDGSPPRRVFHISGGNHYFDGDLYVVTNLDVPQARVAKMLDEQLSPSGDVDEIAAKANAQGWLAYTGADTVYGRARYTHFALLRLRGAVYLLGYDVDLRDPTAVLFKPLPSGKLKTVCTFQNVGVNL